MIELLELTIKNFGTWESCRLVLQDQGLTCIRGANGAGKCLPGWTLISDARNGQTLSISEWYKKVGNGETLVVWGLDADLKLRPANVTEVFATGRKNICRVWLANGIYEDVSVSHPVMTDRGPVRADHLRTGDMIQVPRHLAATGEYNLTPFTDADVIIAAGLLAEGCLRGQIYGFTNGDPEIVRLMDSALRSRGLCLSPATRNDPQMLGYNLKSLYSGVKRKRQLILDVVSLCDEIGIPLSSLSGHATEIRAGKLTLSYDILIKLGCQYGNDYFFDLAEKLHPHEALRRVYNSWGIAGLLAKEKHLPEIFYLMTDAQVKKFLMFFWACDGYVSDFTRRKKRSGREISVTLASRPLIVGISRLLLRLGVQTAIRYRKMEKKFDAWTIVPIGRESSERLCNVLLNMPCKMKRNRIRNVLRVYSNTAVNDNLDVIPPSIFAPEVERASKSSGKAFFNKDAGLTYSRRQLQEHGRSRDKVLRYANHFNDERLSQIANSDIGWVAFERRQVFKKTFETYDISVDNRTHLYALGSFITHNSSLFRAIEWCLYGKTAEGFKVSELTTNNKPTWVRLIFRVNGDLYRLTRYRNDPAYGNKIQLEGRYVPQTDEDSLMSDVQAHITRLLGVDDRMFLSSVYLAQRQFHYFHTLSDTGKKEFLESLTYGSLFGRCEQFVRERCRKLENQISQLSGEIDGLQYSLEQLREEQKIRASTNLVSAEKYQKEIVRCSTMIEQEKQLVAQARQRIDDCTHFHTEYYKRVREIQELQSTITIIQDMEACPTCFRYMSNQERESAIKDFHAQVIFKERRVEICKPYKDVTLTLENEIRTHEASIYSFQAKMQMMKARIIASKYTEKDVQVEQQLEDKLARLQNKYKNILNELAHWKFWVVGFSFKGLRSIILGHAVSQVQDLTNHYLRKIGRNLEQFTMEFDNSKLSSMFGKRSYASLSGGEKQITDLCTALSIRDTAEMYNKSRFNILILDEPLESIDKHFTARAQDLLQEVAKPSTFLITHQSLDADFDRIYDVRKVDGVSYLMLQYSRR